MQLQFIKNNQRKKENSDYNINDDDFTRSPCLTFSLIYLKASTEHHLNLYVLAHFDTAGMWTHDPRWLDYDTGRHALY